MYSVADAVQICSSAACATASPQNWSLISALSIIDRTLPNRVRFIRFVTPVTCGLYVDEVVNIVQILLKPLNLRNSGVLFE